MQLSELVNAEGYSEWIHLVAEFTLKSLHSWKVCIYDYLICSLKELDYTLLENVGNCVKYFGNNFVQIGLMARIFK